MKEKSLLFQTARGDEAEARAEISPENSPISHHRPQAEGQELSWMKTAASFHHWALLCCLRPHGQLGADINAGNLEAGKEILS